MTGRHRKLCIKGVFRSDEFLKLSGSEKDGSGKVPGYSDKE